MDDNLITKEKILDLLNQSDDLPPLPDVLLNLNKKINDPDTDMEEISELIETEPVLAGRLIKLANSVLFGGGREKAEVLSTAIMRLGLKMVLDLAYTLELPKMFGRKKNFDQLKLWKHSLAVAYLSQNLGRKLTLTREDQDNVYTAGLMHDIGILVFDFLIPREFEAFLKEVKSSEESLEVLEEQKFGIAHSELGAAFITKRWPIAENVIQAVAGHHNRESLQKPVTGVLAVVGIANAIANGCEISNELTAFKEEPPEGGYHEVLDLSPEELDDLIVKTREGVEQTEMVLTR